MFAQSLFNHGRSGLNWPSVPDGLLLVRRQDAGRPAEQGCDHNDEQRAVTPANVACHGSLLTKLLTGF